MERDPTRNGKKVIRPVINSEHVLEPNEQNQRRRSIQSSHFIRFSLPHRDRIFPSHQISSSSESSHVLVGDDVGFPVDRRQLLLADLLIPVASPLRLLCHAAELEHHPHSQHHRFRVVGHAYQSPGHRRRPLVGRLSRGVRRARILPLLLLRLLRLHHLTDNSSSIGVFIA